jgi:PEP-CTERM motif
VRFTSLKLSVLALAVIGALALSPAALATTCPAGDTCMDLTQSNLNVAGPYGTVELSQNGGNVDVTIVMNSGFGVLLNGGDLGINTTGGLVLNGSSLSGFNISGVSTSLKSNGTIGSFSFNYIFKTSVSGGQQFPTTLSFTISNATISQLTGFGIHLCVVNGQGNGCALTGFAVTGSTPPAVPEPGTLGMLGTGLVGIAGLVRRRFIS